MPDDDNGVILRRFIADLNHARVVAGRPSYGRLERLSAQLLNERSGDVDLRVLSSSTTQEILTGQRGSVPPWPWVFSYVRVLRFAASKAGVCAESVGTIDEWKRKHEAACAAVPASRPAGRRRGRVAGDWTGSTGPLPAALSAWSAAGPDRAGGPSSQAWWGFSGPWWQGSDAIPERLPFYLYLESAARLIRVYEPRVIPGLLQVGAYSRAAISRRLPAASTAEVGSLVDLRMRRQRVLGQQGMRQVWAVVEEAALRSPWPGRKIMRAQIRRLIDITEQPNVALGILPLGFDDNTTIKESITLFRFAESHLGDVVCLEQPGTGQFLYARGSTEHYGQLMDLLGIRASYTRSNVQNVLSKILRES